MASKAVLGLNEAFPSLNAQLFGKCSILPLSIQYSLLTESVTVLLWHTVKSLCLWKASDFKGKEILQRQ